VTLSEQAFARQKVVNPAQAGTRLLQLFGMAHQRSSAPFDAGGRRVPAFAGMTANISNE